VSHEQTSDSEVPKKTKKRRTQSYNATTSYRSFRRKAKTPLSSASNTSTRVADKSDSSSDYDDNTDTLDNNTRNGNREPTASQPILDVNIPSTSTGITANGKGYLFRIANNTYDSDDDQSIPDTNNSENNNLLRVLRSPPIQNNNNNNNNINNSNYTNHADEGPSTSTHRNNFRLNHPEHNGARKKFRTQEDEHDFEDYASSNSNSNSLQSSTSAESSSSSNESYSNYFSNKKRRLNNGSSVGAANEEIASTSNGMFGTPLNKVKSTDPDSGIPPSIHSPSSSSKGSTSNCYEVMKKIDAVKRNYRKNMQTSDDSD
jgi:hypothetical protein